MEIIPLQLEHFSEYKKLLNQLSPTDFSIDQFSTFLECLHDNHRVYVLQVETLIIGCVTLIIEHKLIHCEAVCSAFGRTIPLEECEAVSSLSLCDNEQSPLDCLRQFEQKRSFCSESHRDCKAVSSAKGIAVSSTRGGTVMHVEDLVIDSEYRKYGFGSKILDFVKELAKELNCYKVILNCNCKVIDFYERNKFLNENYQMVFRL